MSSLEQQHEQFLKDNHWAKGFTFENWKRFILEPKLKSAKDKLDKLKEDE